MLSRPMTGDSPGGSCALSGVFPGDQVVIACETSRTLGLGTNIKGAQGLPDMDPTGKVPKDLGTKYGKMIAAADGFAQVRKQNWT
jgi:hypothetical protein